MKRFSGLTTKTTNTDLFQYFLKLLKRKFPGEISDVEIAEYFFHLSLHDIHDGLNSKSLSICKIEDFLQNTIDRYLDEREPIVISLRLWYYFQHVAADQLNILHVRETIEKERQEEMDRRMKSILQYPETSNAMQLEDMFLQIQAFIVVAYNLGCPKNHVLLKRVREAINHIWKDDDLHNYVQRKKYQRSEYLLKLAATISGMLVFNSYDPDGEKEHLKNLVAELETAKKTIEESFEMGTKRSTGLVKLGKRCLENAINIFLRDGYLRCYWPVEKLRTINQHVALFDNYYYLVQRLRGIYEKTDYLVEVETKKFKCVADKVNELFTYHPIVGSECAFPHFDYLSKLWRVLLVYSAHLTEIIKVKKNLDELMCWENGIEERFKDAVKDINVYVVNMKYPIDYNIDDLLKEAKKIPPQLNIIHVNLKDFLKNYCTLTMVLTKGFLTPATFYRKLCKNSDTLFGFAEADYAKFAERNVREFLEILKNVIFTNFHLIVLFNVVDHVMEHIVVTKPEDNNLVKTSQDFGGQTELMIPNDPTISRYSTKITWNVWDFHRETIRLANVRRRHTHSAQSNLSYAKRNAQNQAYYTREHKGF